MKPFLVIIIFATIILWGAFLIYADGAIKPRNKKPTSESEQLKWSK